MKKILMLICLMAMVLSANAQNEIKYKDLVQLDFKFNIFGKYENSELSTLILKGGGSSNPYDYYWYYVLPVDSIEGFVSYLKKVKEEFVLFEKYAENNEIWLSKTQIKIPYSLCVGFFRERYIDVSNSIISKQKYFECHPNCNVETIFKVEKGVCSFNILPVMENNVKDYYQPIMLGHSMSLLVLDILIGKLERIVLK